MTHPNSVEYDVTFQLSSGYCQRTTLNNHLIKIQFIGFGDVVVNVFGTCSCNCEKQKVHVHTCTLNNHSSNNCTIREMLVGEFIYIDGFQKIINNKIIKLFPCSHAEQLHSIFISIFLIIFYT